MFPAVPSCPPRIWPTMSTCAGARCTWSWIIRSAANGTTSACRSSFRLRRRRLNARRWAGGRAIRIRFAIIGQQDFGKAVLEAFLARGDQAVAVFCAPEKEGARPDALRLAAEQRNLKVHQFK